MTALTLSKAGTMMDPHSQKTRAGRGNPKHPGCKAANIVAVFLCLPKTKRAGKARASCYGGLIQAAFGAGRFLYPVFHPVSVRRPFRGKNKRRFITQYRRCRHG